jgi:hypothetical protein
MPHMVAAAVLPAACIRTGCKLTLYASRQLRYTDACIRTGCKLILVYACWQLQAQQQWLHHVCELPTIIMLAAMCMTQLQIHEVGYHSLCLILVDGCTDTDQL